VKKVCVLAVGLITATAFADVAIIWENPGFYVDEGGTYDVGPLLTQLIWSESEPVAATGLATDTASRNGGLIAAQGEVELASETKDYAQFLSTTAIIYTDADVAAIGGDPVVNDGYVFIRAWNQEGTYYAQSDTGVSLLSPTLVEYNAQDTGTILDIKGAATGASTNIEAIPEPATLGLMGIAGIGLYLARRKARC
jgi:hypothetical protein